MGLTRRRFCELCVLSGGALLGACADSPGPADELAPDLGADGTAPPDLAMECRRATGLAPGDLAIGQARALPRRTLYVCRDARGLFAVSAICTHYACLADLDGAGFTCPCHGSRFALDGSVEVGPAKAPLAHYALSIGADGLLVVDTCTRVPFDTRLTI